MRSIMDIIWGRPRKIVPINVNNHQIKYAHVLVTTFTETVHIFYLSTSILL